MCQCQQTGTHLVIVPATDQGKASPTCFASSEERSGGIWGQGGGLGATNGRLPEVGGGLCQGLDPVIDDVSSSSHPSQRTTSPGTLSRRHSTTTPVIIDCFLTHRVDRNIVRVHALLDLPSSFLPGPRISVPGGVTAMVMELVEVSTSWSVVPSSRICLQQACERKQRGL